MKNSKMNRRIRKKLYLGEYAVMGFEFSTSLSGLNDEQTNEFFDALLLFIESRSLLIGGGGAQGGESAPDRHGRADDHRPVAALGEAGDLAVEGFLARMLDRVAFLTDREFRGVGLRIDRAGSL